MNNLERDFGKLEANVEVLKEDMAVVKKDLQEIKEAVQGRNAIVKSDTARLGTVAVVASIATQVFNWLKPFS